MERSVRWICSFVGSQKGQLTHEQEFVKLLDSHLWTPENTLRIEELIALGVNVNLKNSSGLTALTLSVVRAKPQLTKSLLCTGADPDIAITSTVTQDASKENYKTGFLGLLKQAQSSTADVMMQRSHTALFAATFQRKCDIVRLLLERGADCSVKNQYDQTALDIASINGFTEIADMLLPKKQKIL